MYTGQKIRILRILRQVRQTEMARKLGISQPSYSALEKRSKISEKRAKEILAILKFSKKKAEKTLSILLPFANK